MNNYINVSYTKIHLELTPGTVETLSKYTPAGCPFDNYTMLDLLNDLVKNHAWTLENGRKYDIITFLKLSNNIKARVYLKGFESLIN